MTPPFDPGLQPERTELAWRRTALAVGVGALVALRLLPASLGDPWWTLVGFAGLLSAVGIWLHGRRRLCLVNAVLSRDGDRGRLPGSASLAALAAFTLVTALMASLVVVAIELTRSA